MQFLFPYDGCVLTSRDGEPDGGSLIVPARVSAACGRRIRINDRDAVECAPGVYTARISVDGYRNALVACDLDCGGRIQAAVYWLAAADGAYRLSLDDNIWFLRDLARNSGVYSSLFDNPYLGMLQRLHDEFGAKVHINIYYRCEDFDLSQMPDRYKDEWIANASWLRLSFHAKQNEPDRPYQNTTYEEMRRDFLQVTREIVRFAGAELLSPVTTVHWGACTVEGVRALRALGVRALVGYFTRDEDGRPFVSYYLTPADLERFDGRDFMRDEREDMLFGRVDMVLNLGKLEDIVPALDALDKAPARNAFMEFLIHEQYFYPDYAAWLPDYEQRLRTALRWATEHGYRPAFLHEAALEAGLSVYLSHWQI